MDSTYSSLLGIVIDAELLLHAAAFALLLHLNIGCLSPDLEVHLARHWINHLLLLRSSISAEDCLRLQPRLELRCTLSLLCLSQWSSLRLCWHRLRCELGFLFCRISKDILSCHLHCVPVDQWLPWLA